MNRSSTRRTFLKQALAGSAAMWLGSSPAITARPGAGSATRRPNLVFLFSDQHAFDMLGCMGNQQIHTPRLDALAAEGLCFEHCIANVPVCTPSRGTLLSGLHPLRHGAFHNDVQMLPNEGRYFPQVLAQNGYRTAYIGKWHLLGGDRNRPIPRGALRYGFDGPFLSNNCTVQFDAETAYYWNEAGQRELYGAWEPYGQSRQAVDFLKTVKSDEPFALFVSWHPPHDHGMRDGLYDYSTLPELMELYDPQKIRVRANVEDTPPRRRQYQEYMATCSGIDRAVAMVLDELRARGLDDNTLVVYTADHGDLLGSHGRPKPKTFPEQESIRIPLLLRYPGHLKAGQRTAVPIGLLDLMPTLLGLMELEVPGTCQGRNLAPVLLGQSSAVPESVPLYFPAPHAWRGVYTPRYTYAFAEDAAADCRVLYDRQATPAETHNAFADPASRTVREHLHGLTREWLEHFADPCPLSAELFRVCGLDPARFQQPGMEARLAASPLELLRRQPFKSFLS